ncbi:PepSY-associated TM helix domain-containing protein [Salibacter halophilus]|uniref:PepSY domain-containing protein n=1 Tax=Salibacter halophilus TaxID=1803916 RepID=A0A6N6M9N3_9FLAO|nr:PepSY-associated TM helix domain-containing protein [Salibacter halophilus]KAB1064866.1 PepSY domain-containing protein [Salibacter halophilus]
MALKKNITFRSVIRQLHLFLGLITGIIVFIVAITGCLWVFQEEIRELTREPFSYEVSHNNAMVTPTRAKKMAQSVFPDKRIHGTLYSGQENPVEVIFYQSEPEEFYRMVYLHPQSGELIRSENLLNGFFHFVLDGHMYLWLPESIGHEVVRWGTAIFAIMLITGIVLWWPKTKKLQKRHFWFKWNKRTKWKKKNYDYHNISGFYASLLGLTIAFTGCVMAFDPFESVVYDTIGGEKETNFSIPANESGSYKEKNVPAIDQLLPKLRKTYSDAFSFEFHYPHTDSSSIYVEVTNREGTFYKNDYRFYDQNTLAELSTPSIYGDYSAASFSDKVIRMNYDIHVGSIAGLPGKIIMFCISLICAALPVTGFLIWLNRKR